MKKGISLIVLVITIIILLILAGAVILSIFTNSPVVTATNAKDNQNRIAIQSAVTMYLSKIMGENRKAVSATGGNLATNTAYYQIAGVNTVFTSNDIAITLPTGNWVLSGSGTIIGP